MGEKVNNNTGHVISDVFTEGKGGRKVYRWIDSLGVLICSQWISDASTRILVNTPFLVPAAVVLSRGGVVLQYSWYTGLLDR